MSNYCSDTLRMHNLKFQTIIALRSFSSADYVLRRFLYVISFDEFVNSFTLDCSFNLKIMWIFKHIFDSIVLCMHSAQFNKIINYIVSVQSHILELFLNEN